MPSFFLEPGQTQPIFITYDWILAIPTVQKYKQLESPGADGYF